MRATRNRVYGVTRIGGSNPSSSANTKKDAIFKRLFLYSADEPFQASLMLAFNGRDYLLECLL